MHHVRKLAGLALIVPALLASAGGALGAPSLEDLLGQAMAGHPAVLLAKAKVAQAEAELGSVQLEVTRQMIALRTELEGLEQTANKARQQQEAAQQGWEKVKTGDLKDVTEAEAKLTQAKTALADADAKLGRLNVEVEQLIGLLGRLADHAAKAQAPPPEAEPQTPSGPVAEKMMAALDKPVDLEFADLSVADAVKRLREVAKTPVTLDAGREVGEAKVNLQLKDVKLGAALQALEDQCSDLVFVIREYGILATRKDHAREHGFVPVVGLWKSSAEQKAEEASKAAPPPAPPAPAPQ